MDINNVIMDINSSHKLWMDIHNSIMDSHNCIMDIRNSIMENIVEDLQLYP